MADRPEPWLRGDLPDVALHLQPVFFSFAQVGEDLACYTGGLSDEQVWRQVAGRQSIGFHLKHLAGSIDRLITYLTGVPLSAAQLLALEAEHSQDLDGAQLLALVETSMEAARHTLRQQVTPESLFDKRVVGRKQLPTSVLGLLVHLCEHSQRHLGQVIVLSKLLKQE